MWLRRTGEEVNQSADRFYVTWFWLTYELESCTLLILLVEVLLLLDERAARSFAALWARTVDGYNLVKILRI